MTNIRITALTDIGNNIAYSSLVPVVDMAGTPTTKKANLQIVGNLILNGAGGTYFAPAARAILAQSVTNAAQPNITSVGTLSNLVVSGNVSLGAVGNVTITGGTNGQVLTTDGTGELSWTTVSGGGSYGNSNVAAYLPTYTGNVGAGNINATSTVYTSGISSTGLASLTILNVSTTANLGAVGNVRITGGTSGQKLTTDGAGNLSWTNDANSSYGNTNVANYLPTFTGTVGANRISSNTASGSNVEVSANGAVFVFGQGGALYWPTPGGQQRVIETNIDNEFEIKSTTNVVISTDISNANSHFTFAADGAVYCPANAFFEGTRLNVGPGAGNVPLATNPTLVVTDTGLEFIQTALINQSSNGSSDYAAYGADSDETQGFADFGFAGHTFNDPNYTVTNPGDSYMLAQGYANGIGGALVLATGENGNVPDIVFATGGFLANAEFARIDHANNVFHLTRANSGIKFDDGSIQTTAYTGPGVELVNGDNSFALQSDGNVVLSGTEGGVNRGLVWDYGAVANGVNSEVRQDINGLSVRAWTENAGNYTAPVNIITNQDAATNTWTFDGQGNLTVPGNINAINDGGDLGAYITLTPDIGLARLTGREAQSSVNYTNTAWTSATYSGTQIDFVATPDLVSFFNDNQFNVGVNQTLSINGGEPVPFTGYTIGTGNDVIVYTSVTADPDPTTVTSIDFLYQLESSVGIDYDDGTLNVNATGLTINIDNDQTSGPDINLRSGDDITLQAKDKALGSESEGGDINILAGDGADDDGAGNTSSTGGDIQITAGNGGDGNSSSGASGGFTTISGGIGGFAGVTNAAGPGGYVSIQGGDGGGYAGGNAALGGVGGNVSITAGLTTQEGVDGSNVVISSGQAGPNALAGYVDIFTPASANGFGGTWRFDGNGKLTFPGTPRIDTYTNNFEVQAAESINFEANAVVNIYTDTGNAAYQWQFGDDGNLILAGGSSVIQSIANSSLDPTLPNVSTMVFTPDANYNSQVLVLDPTAPGHIHLRAYAFSNIDDPAANIFLGGEDTSFEITSGANNQAVIHSGGNDWTFGSDGNLTIPGSSGGFIKTVSNASIGIAAMDNGTNNPAQLLSMNVGTSAATSIVSAYSTNVAIQTNAAGAINTWAFDSAGNLTLPGNTVAINYANGTAAFGNIVAWTTAPVANTSAGTAGQAAYDAGGNLYVCVAANTWSKFAGTTSW